MADTAHLNNHHRETLSQILQHPVSHNVEWKDVVALLEDAGTVEERHDGKFKVTLGAETEIFDRPRHKDVDEQMVVDLRRMLKNAGYDESVAEARTKED
jgi:thiamine biosynthesis lipoprotein ApbE